jgi:hypothetical protein
VSVQDGCTVCAERTTGWKSFWTQMMELLGDVGHVESRFGLFGDGVSVSARLVHGLRQTYHRLRNHLDAHDGTARWRGSCAISFWSIWR